MDIIDVSKYILRLHSVKVFDEDEVVVHFQPNFNKNKN
jgi:hypothetical protein